jgi:microcystin-dependent protein
MSLPIASSSGARLNSSLNMVGYDIINATQISATTFVGDLSGTTTTATNIAGGAAAQIPYQTGANTTAFIANGTVGQFLQSNGTSAPTFASFSAATALINLIYPVGSIFQSSVSTNPGSYLTGTTWAAYGAGQVLVGKATSGTFVTAGSTGGAETTTISANNLPAHSHPNTATFTGNAASHSHYLNAPAYGGFVTSENGSGVFGADFQRSDIGQNDPAYRWVAIAETLTPSGSVTMTNANNTTTATAISNLQPYIVVYTWTRTA